LYNRHRHCTTRRRVLHDVDGRTPTHIQYMYVGVGRKFSVLGRTSWVVQFVCITV